MQVEIIFTQTNDAKSVVSFSQAEEIYPSYDGYKVKQLD